MKGLRELCILFVMVGFVVGKPALSDFQDSYRDLDAVESGDSPVVVAFRNDTLEFVEDLVTPTSTTEDEEDSYRLEARTEISTDQTILDFEVPTSDPVPYTDEKFAWSKPETRTESEESVGTSVNDDGGDVATLALEDSSSPTR